MVSLSTSLHYQFLTIILYNTTDHWLEAHTQHRPFSLQQCCNSTSGMWRPFTISIVSKLSYSTPWTHMQGVKWSVHLSLFTVSLQYGKGRQMVKSKEYSMALAWTTIRLHTLFAYICIHSPQPGLSVIVLVFGDFAAPVYPCLNQPQRLQRQRETEGKFSTVFHWIILYYTER